MGKCCCHQIPQGRSKYAMNSRQRSIVTLHEDAEVIVRLLLDLGAKIESWPERRRVLSTDYELDFENGKRQMLMFAFEPDNPASKDVPYIEATFTGLSQHGQIRVLHWGRVYCSSLDLESSSRVRAAWEQVESCLKKSFTRVSVGRRSLRGRQYQTSVFIGPKAAQWEKQGETNWIYLLWGAPPADTIEILP